VKNGDAAAEEVVEKMSQKDESDIPTENEVVNMKTEQTEESKEKAAIENDTEQTEESKENAGAAIL